MKNPHIVWASVAVIFILTGGVVALVINGKDVDAIKDLAVLIAIPVLSAFGVSIYQKVDHAAERTDGKLDEVRQATNGNNDKLLKMVESLYNQNTNLALQVTPPAEPLALPSAEVGQED